MAKSTIDKSDEQTKFVAERLGMGPTPRSGAGLRRKGDAQDWLSLAECKTYMEERDSFTVKREWLTKMQRERFEDRKQLAFLVQNFGGPAHKDNYVVVDLETFKMLYDVYKDMVKGEEDAEI